MVFKRFVEIGRVCVINYGPHEGKLCTIVDVIDQNKALIDGPSDVTGVARMKINFRRLALTDLKVTIKRGVKVGALKKAWEADDIMGKWEKTSWAKKKAAKSKRASLTDFDRFKVMLLRKKVRYFLSSEKDLCKRKRSARI